MLLLNTVHGLKAVATKLFNLLLLHVNCKVSSNLALTSNESWRQSTRTTALASGPILSVADANS